MNIDDEKRNRIKKFLKLKWENQACAICNQIAWSLTPAVYELRIVNGFERDPADASLVIRIVCNNCGHCLLFSSDVIGISDGPEEGAESH